MTQGKDISPRPACWVITKTEEQENAKWKEVLRATARSLAEAPLMVMAALGIHPKVRRAQIPGQTSTCAAAPRPSRLYGRHGH